MSNNRVRLFSDILSLDAWHTPFQSNSHESKVHVELSFREGRIGGDDFSLPFTFSVRLKRASVAVKVSEPLAIDRGSIARGVPSAEIELVKFRAVRNKAMASAGLSGSLSIAKYFLAMEGSSKKEVDVTTEEEARIVEKVPPILIRAQPGNGREYKWDLEPSYLGFLDGQPWDPVSEPRLAVRSKDLPIDPLVRVEISCKREDLEITDLKLKDTNLDARLSQAVFRDMNEAAAIQHIKHILEFADLEPGRLDNRFSSILLADVIAAPEVEW